MATQIKCHIENQYIIPPNGLELVISDHCNTTCRQCNHASPIMPKWNVDPVDVARDLGRMAKVYKPAFLKMLGGEPLLHPNLYEVILAARNSEITDHYLLVTNGILLDRLNDGVWQLIDEIEISNYESSGLSKEKLDRARQSAMDHNVKFTHNRYNEFSRTYTRQRIQNNGLVKQIFDTCKVAQVWGCHSIYKGRIYRCPRSIYISTLVGTEIEEGLKIDENISFQSDLITFLNSREYLQSCHYCVGTVGRRVTHNTLPRADWLADFDEPVDNIINWPLLESLLNNNDEFDDETIINKGANGLHRLFQFKK